MYICNCNGITEKGCKAAIAAGACKPAEIYAFHDCEAQCGRCKPEMVDMIKQFQMNQSQKPVDFPFGIAPGFSFNAA